MFPGVSWMKGLPHIPMLLEDGRTFKMWGLCEGLPGTGASLSRDQGKPRLLVLFIID